MTIAIILSMVLVIAAQAVMLWSVFRLLKKSPKRNEGCS